MKCAEPKTNRIRTTILVSGKDSAATSLVEYTDGRFGIFRAGQIVGEKWAADRLRACVDEFQRMSGLAKLSLGEPLLRPHR